MDPHDLTEAEKDRAAHALRDFYVRSHRVLDRIMAAQGASFARARLLLYIAERGSCRSIDLATFFGYAPRTVTEAIDGLERDGLVRREPDPDDRRAKQLSLTGEGRAAADAAEITRRAHIGRVFGALSADEGAELVRLLGRLNDRLAELGG